MFGEGGVALGAQAALLSDQPVHTLLSWLLERSEAPRFDDDVLVFWLQRKAAAHHATPADVRAA